MTIAYDDFARVDIRVGTVKRAEPFPDRGVVLAPVAEPHLLLRRIERPVRTAGAKPEVEDLLDFSHLVV